MGKCYGMFYIHNFCRFQNTILNTGFLKGHKSLTKSPNRLTFAKIFRQIVFGHPRIPELYHPNLTYFLAIGWVKRHGQKFNF